MYHPTERESLSSIFDILTGLCLRIQRIERPGIAHSEVARKRTRVNGAWRRSRNYTQGGGVQGGRVCRRTPDFNDCILARRHRLIEVLQQLRPTEQLGECKPEWRLLDDDNFHFSRCPTNSDFTALCYSVANAGAKSIKKHSAPESAGQVIFIVAYQR